MSDVERLAKDLGSALDDVRDDAFTRVRPFLRDAGDGTEETGMKLWKGLFYGMWNLDGDTQQHARACAISDCLLDEDMTLKCRRMFWSTFLATLRREWIMIDQYRLDKYYTLARKMLHAVWRLAVRTQWSHKEFFASLGDEIFSKDGVAPGIPSHFVEIYIEELDKALQEEKSDAMTQRSFACVILPFAKTLRTATSPRPVLERKIHSFVFDTLMQKVKETKEEEAFLAAVEQLGLGAVFGTASASLPIDEGALETKKKSNWAESMPLHKTDPKRKGGSTLHGQKKKKRRKGRGRRRLQTP